MAQKTHVQLLDDLDPKGETEAHETVQFGLDGEQREIDLHKDNAARLRAALAEFMEHSRPSGNGSRASKKRDAASRKEAKHCRAWLKSMGLDSGLSERGRIPADLLKRWEDAGKPHMPGVA